MVNIAAILGRKHCAVYSSLYLDLDIILFLFLLERRIATSGIYIASTSSNINTYALYLPSKTSTLT